MTFAIPYICFFSLLVFISIITKNKYSSTEINKTFYSGLVILQYLFIVFSFVLFLSFRGNVYFDWKSYSQFYDDIPSIFENNFFAKITTVSKKGWDIGFCYLGAICKIFSDEYLFFQCINSFLDLLCFFILFRKYYSRQLFCLCLCFFYCFAGSYIEVNLLRNSKSIFLFLFSIDYLHDKKWIKFLVLNLIGYLFHGSSFIYIMVAPYLVRKRNNYYILFFIFIISNFMYIFGINIVSIFLTFIFKFLPSSLSKLSVFITRYQKDGAYGITIGYLERCFTFFIFYFFRKDIKSIKNGQLFLNSFYIYYFSSLILAPLVTVCERILTLFVYCYWFIYPHIFSKLKTKNQKYFFIFIFLLYGILKLYTSNKTEDYIYSNFLFG